MTARPSPEDVERRAAHVEPGWLRCVVVGPDTNDTSHVIAIVQDSTYAGSRVSVHRDCVRRDLVVRDRIAPMLTAERESGRREAFACEWRTDGFGKERAELWCGLLPAGSIMHQHENAKWHPGQWRGWSMVLGTDGDGDQTGWFATADEARTSVEDALQSAIRVRAAALPATGEHQSTAIGVVFPTRGFPSEGDGGQKSSGAAKPEPVRADAVGVLRELEWAGEPTFPNDGEFAGYAVDTCPWCDQRKDHGHTPDCRLAAALRHSQPDADARVRALKQRLKVAEEAYENGRQQVADLQARLAAAEAALEPFALVAERDVGSDEADADFFTPATRYNQAPRLLVGDLRRARAALDTGQGR